MSSEYKIRLEAFEGPLALLMHLIDKNQIDIYDIPIATITEQYLASLEELVEVDLDVLADFLLMAATLINIKSRLLLPRPRVEDTMEEEEDPRQELVNRLVVIPLLIVLGTAWIPSVIAVPLTPVIAVTAALFALLWAMPPDSGAAHTGVVLAVSAQLLVVAAAAGIVTVYEDFAADDTTLALLLFAVPLSRMIGSGWVVVTVIDGSLAPGGDRHGVRYPSTLNTP